jgi:hypothetical protein
MFPLILPKPVTYLDPLVPRDQIFEEEETVPLNFVRTEKVVVKMPKLNDDVEDSTVEVESSKEKKSVDVSWELIDNPFLRPVKPHRKPPKKSS